MDGLLKEGTSILLDHRRKLCLQPSRVRTFPQHEISIVIIAEPIVIGTGILVFHHGYKEVSGKMRLSGYIPDDTRHPIGNTVIGDQVLPNYISAIKIFPCHGLSDDDRPRSHQ